VGRRFCQLSERAVATVGCDRVGRGVLLTELQHVAPPPAPADLDEGAGPAAGEGRTVERLPASVCVSIFLDKNRRYIGESQSKHGRQKGRSGRRTTLRLAAAAGPTIQLGTRRRTLTATLLTEAAAQLIVIVTSLS
jgi:hypothetical protein